MTAALARIRNDKVSALSTAPIVPHSSRGVKTREAVNRALKLGVTVFLLDEDDNRDRIAAGGRILRNQDLPALLRGLGNP